jgi:hypothetical protein
MAIPKDDQVTTKRLVLDALAMQIKVRPDRDFLRFRERNYTYAESLRRQDGPLHDPRAHTVSR